MRCANLIEHEKKRPKMKKYLFMLAGVAAFALVCGAAYRILNRDVAFTTPYQAVLLDDNQVYYGKLSGFSGKHPVLTNVYYVKSGVDPKTKETKAYW
jgi:hypothetical protein